MSFLRTGIAGDRRDIAAIAQRRRGVGAGGHGASKTRLMSSGQWRARLCVGGMSILQTSRSCSVGRVPAPLPDTRGAAKLFDQLVGAQEKCLGNR